MQGMSSDNLVRADNITFAGVKNRNETWEIKFTPCLKDGSIKATDIDKCMVVEIEIDTWYRTNETVASEISSALSRLNIYNRKELFEALKYRRMYTMAKVPVADRKKTGTKKMFLCVHN